MRPISKLFDAAVMSDGKLCINYACAFLAATWWAREAFHWTSAAYCGQQFRSPCHVLPAVKNGAAVHWLTAE